MSAMTGKAASAHLSMAAIKQKRRWYGDARQCERRLEAVAGRQGQACRPGSLEHGCPGDDSPSHDLHTLEPIGCGRA